MGHPKLFLFISLPQLAAGKLVDGMTKGKVTLPFVAVVVMATSQTFVHSSHNSRSGLSAFPTGLGPFSDLPQHCVLDYFRPSAFGGLL